MKKLFPLLFVSTFLFTACEGPQGPPGPPGEDGSDGLDGIGYTFEETVTFDYFSDENLYSALIEISDDIVTVEPEADAVLVYRLEIQSDNQGEFDTWSLLPQNFFLDEGIIQYVYNHTANDVEVIIDGNFNLANLNDSYTAGQTFRVIVVPSLFAQDPNINLMDMKAVMNAMDMEESDVKRLN